MVFGDGRGYDAKACFESIAEKGAIQGVRVGKNAQIKAKSSTMRRKAVPEQKKKKNCEE